MTLCDAPDVRLRGYMWAAASLLTSGYAAWRGYNSQSNVMRCSPREVLKIGIMQTVFVAQNNDNVASTLPVAYDWIDILLR